jgi:hypothetical protein
MSWAPASDGAHVRIPFWQFARLSSRWTRLPELYVAVATWWLCRAPSMRVAWTSFSEAEYVYLDTFYLPMGDPGDVTMEEQRSHGVNGWMAEALKHGQRLAAIAPAFMRNLTFFRGDFHVVPDDMSRADVASALEFVGRQPQPTVFAVSAGYWAKLIITTAFERFPQHTFIDVGRALNPYAGHVETGVNPKGITWYCERERNLSMSLAASMAVGGEEEEEEGDGGQDRGDALVTSWMKKNDKVDIEPVISWMAPGVCEACEGPNPGEACGGDVWPIAADLMRNLADFNVTNLDLFNM